MVMVPLLTLVLLLACFTQGKLIGNAYPFEIPGATFNVITYGAKGDGKTDNTKAIQATFDAAGKSGGTVLFPAGTYLTFPFSFSGSNTIMNIATGATILASSSKVNWPTTTTTGGGPMAFISAVSGMDNLGVVGAGNVDGQGSVWWGNKTAPRPDLMLLQNTNHLYIQGVTFMNSPNHNLELYANFAELDDVTILAPSTSPNTDGVDLHGEPFYIHDSHIAVGDDNVAIHVSNVLVENCYFGSGHGASIGSISSGNYENITVRGVTFDGTEAGPKIKTDPGATGSIKGVVYQNLTLIGVEYALQIDMFYDDGPNKTTTMKISDITFQDISGTATIPGSLMCQPSSPCTGLILKNIQISKSTKKWACEESSGTQTNVLPTSCISTK